MVKETESQEVFMCLDFALPLSKYMVLAVPGLWEMIIDSVPNVLAQRDTENVHKASLPLGR